MLKHAKTDFQALLRIIFFAVVLSAFFALVVYFTPLSENAMRFFSFITLFVSVFMGARYAAWRIRNRGLLHGLRVGLVFFLLMTIATFLFRQQALDTSEILPTLGLVLVASAAGGIVGVNQRSRRRRSSRPYYFQ